MDARTAADLDRYLTTDPHQDPYDGTPQDIGTDTPTIDTATIDAATTNAATVTPLTACKQVVAILAQRQTFPADLALIRATCTAAIDAAAQDAATRNETATENHRRADALAARLESADGPMLMDALAALAQRNYRTAAQILIDVIDGV